MLVPATSGIHVGMVLNQCALQTCGCPTSAAAAGCETAARQRCRRSSGVATATHSTGAGVAVQVAESSFFPAIQLSAMIR